MPSAPRIRVSIVDPDIHYRLFLTSSLNASLRHLLLHTATTAAEARAWPDLIAPDVAIVEADLPDGSSAALIRDLRVRFPSTLFLVLTRDSEDAQLTDAIHAGAVGYLLKSDGRDAVFTAIDEALSGGAPLSRGVARNVLRILRTSASPFPAQATGNATQNDAPAPGSESQPT